MKIPSAKMPAGFFISKEKTPLPHWVEAFCFCKLAHSDHFLGAGGMNGHGGIEVGFGGAHFHGHAEALKANK